MRSARPANTGFSLIEVVVGLALGSLVLYGATGLLRSGSRLAAAHARRIEHQGTLRISSHILASELRLLDPGADLELVDAHSLELRAVRGVGLICASHGNHLLLRYRGVRRPDPAKDSVLVVDEAGHADVRPLESSVAVENRCAVSDGERLFRWEVGGRAPDATLALLFEHGSYHLAGGALRYLRGAGGRQPLTPESLDIDASRITYRTRPSGPSPPGAGESALLEVDLATLSPDGGRGAADHSASNRRLRIPLLNANETGPIRSVGGQPW